MARIVLVGWLTVMWVLLWESITLANVVTGVLAAGALVIVFPPVVSNDDPVVIRPVSAISFLLWFTWALVVSNVKVAAEVVAPPSRSNIRTAVVAVRLQTRSGRLATVIAHAITLTPGTLTVDARGRPAVLFIHVLTFDDVDSVRAEVGDLERRVVRAFGTASERAQICGPPAPTPAAVPVVDLTGLRRGPGGPMIALALVLLSVGGAGFVFRLVRGPTLADRIISLDGTLTIVVTAIVAWSAYTGDSTFLIVAVVVALVAFLGTSAFARFVEVRNR